MTYLIRRLIVWVGLLATPRGWHRRSPSPPLPSCVAPTSAASAPLPAHRSPYGVDTLIDGSATAAVRPYLVAHEQRQGWRELASPPDALLAAGPYCLDAVEAA
jgi:hypothetical protein